MSTRLRPADRGSPVCGRPGTVMAGLSVAGVQAGEIARPVEQADVCRDEMVTLQRGREDEAIRGTNVHGAQGPGTAGDGSVYGNLN
ncbi:MAG: hypothetical protein F4151_07160 [Gammaproteobacteria bacterium]|nr:hypothetical protein [Gammaproteobacteria bacterium]